MRPPLRGPTLEETNLGFAIQCAEDAKRALSPTPPEPRDRDDIEPSPPPRVPKLACPQCGLVMDYATPGMAAMQLTKHRKKVHPDTVEAY